MDYFQLLFIQYQRIGDPEYNAVKIINICLHTGAGDLCVVFIIDGVGSKWDTVKHINISLIISAGAVWIADEVEIKLTK